VKALETHLAEAAVDHLLDGIPGVGDVGDGVPGHGYKLEQTEENGQALLVPPERGAER